VLRCYDVYFRGRDGPEGDEAKLICSTFRITRSGGCGFGRDAITMVTANIRDLSRRTTKTVASRMLLLLQYHACTRVQFHMCPRALHRFARSQSPDFGRRLYFSLRDTRAVACVRACRLERLDIQRLISTTRTCHLLTDRTRGTMNEQRCSGTCTRRLPLYNLYSPPQRRPAARPSIGDVFLTGVGVKNSTVVVPDTMWY
jgi:hypothetical protein